MPLRYFDWSKSSIYFSLSCHFKVLKPYIFFIYSRYNSLVCTFPKVSSLAFLILSSNLNTKDEYERSLKVSCLSVYIIEDGHDSSDSSAWVAGTDRNNEGTWEWYDGLTNTYKPYTYTHWSSDEPDAGLFSFKCHQLCL